MTDKISKLPIGGAKDKRNRKRGIDRKFYIDLLHKSEEDSSEKAEVEEITTSGSQIDVEITENTPEATTKSGQQSQQSSTTIFEENSTEKTSEENQAAASVGESSVIITSESSSTTTEDSTSGATATAGSTSLSLATTSAKPGEAGNEHSYYGGSPLENADLIYITTTEGAALADDGFRYDFKPEFRPSVQYEFLDYKVHPELHFVPMVGQN